MDYNESNDSLKSMIKSTVKYKNLTEIELTNLCNSIIEIQKNQNNTNLSISLISMFINLTSNTKSIVGKNWKTTLFLTSIGITSILLIKMYQK
jgi:hypothetical protein